MAIPNTSGMFNYFENITKQAQELVAAEQKPGFKPSDFDFETVVSCSHCSTPIQGKKFSCARCKAPIYCSRKCAETDWYRTPIPGAPTHRDLCKDNQRHMKKVPDIQAILLQFPWGRIEKDTSFSEDICRGRYNVLGGSNMGYWSHRGGPIPHVDSGEINQFLPPEYMKLLDFMGEKFNHTDGADLLKERHPTDRDGWRLEPELIPFLRFSSLWEPPRLATKVQIKDWDSWYKWRRLPKESPAALLMSFPLSVYWILVEVLKIADPKKGSFDSDPIPLTIHCIGAEKELNFVPLFGELALLLPHYNIKIVMFSKAVHTLTSLAKSKPNSLAAAALESPARPVFTYTAPEESGAGKVSVYLDASDSWSPSRLVEHGGPYARPDALVALNAGLSSYQSWRPVVIWSLANAMPFAVTEYAEQSCETQRGDFGRLLAMQAQRPGSVDSGPWAPTPSQCWTAMTTRARSAEDFPIVMNPFQRPGQRPLPTYLPNAPNGFTLRVCPYAGAGESSPQVRTGRTNSPEAVVDIAEGLDDLHVEDLD